ncbi:hypothetical protein TNCV_2243521 [Trichonephila clavipes]|nr:hypothetical protein TNCV_2243521 [Trichonephila clavipes]
MPFQLGSKLTTFGLEVQRELSIELQRHDERFCFLCMQLDFFVVYYNSNSVAPQPMKARSYCAHPRLRDHWGQRCMSRCPDQVVSLKRNQLDDFTRGRMIGKLEEGRTVTSVASEFAINKSVFAPLESVPNHRYSC